MDVSPQTESPIILPADKPKKKFPTWLKVFMVLCGLSLFALIGLYIGVVYWVIPTVSQFTQQQAKKLGVSDATNAVVIRPGSSFKVAQAFNVLGIKVLRLKHAPSQQNFLVVAGLDSASSKDLFEKEFTAEQLSMMAKTMMQAQNPQHKEAITIDSFKTLSQSTLQVHGQTVPVKKIQVGLSIQGESHPRLFQGEVGRVSTQQGKDEIVVSFAEQAKYHSGLMPKFLQDVSLKPESATP